MFDGCFEFSTMHHNDINVNVNVTQDLACEASGDGCSDGLLETPRHKDFVVWIKEMWNFEKVSGKRERERHTMQNTHNS